MNISIKSIYTFILTLAGLLALAGCAKKAQPQGEESEHGVLITSIEPQRYILEQIVGKHYTVTSLVENGANPETFEPTISRRMAVERSSACFITGQLPFESAIRKSIKGQTPVVDTSEGVEFIFGTHSHKHGDSHKDDVHSTDPHIWTSVKNAKIMAANMFEALKTIDPANIDEYARNFDKFSLHLDSIDDALRNRLADARYKNFAVWHPSLTYFARDYGLHQISVGQESKEISPKKMREIIDKASADSVKVFFFQKEYDSRQAETINERIGSEMVIINPLSYDWEGQFNTIANALTATRP